MNAIVRHSFLTDLQMFTDMEVEALYFEMALPIRTAKFLTLLMSAGSVNYFQVDGGGLYYFFIIIIIVSGVRLSPLGTAATAGLLYQPQMIDDGDCGAIGGMKIGRGTRSTRRKSAPVPLCPPQIPHEQNRAETQAAVVGSQRLTA
jgi:hypothetical protein